MSGTTRRTSAINSGRSFCVASRICMTLTAYQDKPLFSSPPIKSLPQLHNAKPLSHQPLEAWPPDQVVGQLLAGKHRERGLSAVGNHLGSLIHRQRAVLRD